MADRIWELQTSGKHQVVYICDSVSLNTIASFILKSESNHEQNETNKLPLLLILVQFFLGAAVIMTFFLVMLLNLLSVLSVKPERQVKFQLN